MSRGPSRFETKRSVRPSGDQTGLWWSLVVSSDSAVGTPPDAGTSTTWLGARFPNVGPGCRYSQFPFTQAIHRESPDHAQEVSSGATATSRVTPPVTRRASSESPLTKAISSPSGDHAAVTTTEVGDGGMVAVAEPPSAGAIETPPRVR